MAVYKCKMCGAQLEVEQGSTVATCAYCGSKQTVPDADDERKESLFNRANALRANCEFDKALMAYQSILGIFPDEPEAHWGITLCRYGIEYVDDPATKTKKPTIHRVSYDSILKDTDYLAAISRADIIAREVYQEQAQEIADIQKNLLAISQKEEPFDIFICYKETDENGRRTQDSVIAQDIYGALVDRGYKVFFARITLENKLGTMYEPYIFAALNSAKIMLAIGTKKSYFEAVWVQNEWSRYLDLMKTRPDRYLIPCYKDMNAYEMPEAFLSLQAQDLSKLGYIQDLTRGIDKIMGRDSNQQPQTTKVIQTDVNVDALLTRAEILIGDKSYEKADALLERALNNDPKNSQAYLLKLLIELKLTTIDDLKNQPKNLANNSNFKKAFDFGDSAQKSRLSAINEWIDKRNEEERLQKIYNVAVNYREAGQYAEAEQTFASIAGYRDATKQAAECVKLGKEGIYNRATLMKTRKEYEDAVSNFEKIKDYKDSEQQIAECKELRNQDLYDRACSLRDSGKYDEATRLFMMILKYRDSDAQVDECARLKAEAQKEAVYQACIFKVDINPKEHEDRLRKSCEALATIPGYKDADQLLVRYEGILREYEAQVAKEEEEMARQRAKKLKKAKKIAIFTGSGALVITGALLLTFLFLVPEGKQNQAKELIDAGRYDEAIALLGQNGSYGATQQLKSMVSAGKSFENKDYETGIDYIYNIGGTVDISYDANGGQAPASSETIKKLDHVNNPAEKAGYTFHGWVLDSYSIKASSLYASLKLKAQYDIITYSIEYDLGNGVAEGLPQSYDTEKATVIPNPSRQGYSFLGWTSLGVESPTKDYEIPVGSTGNKTFIANWKANQYDVTIDLNGGQSDYTDYSFVFDNDYSISIPTRVGYTCTYFTDENGNKVEATGKWNIAENNYVLTAVWQANSDTKYTVRYFTEKLDGSYEDAGSEEFSGVSDSEISVLPKNIDGFTPTKNSQKVKIAADGSLVVDFYYTRNSYSLSYVTNGGDEIDSISLKYEEELPTETKAVRDGYTFAGWFAEPTQETPLTKMPAKNASAYAYYSEETKASHFKYSIINAGEVIVSKAESVAGNVVVPEFIEGKPVTSIGSSAFEGCVNVTEVTLPESVNSLGRAVFKGCSLLESITGCSDLQDILQDSFSGCRNLISLPDLSGVKYVGSNAFKDCVRLVDLTLDETLTKIGSYAFSGCVSLLATPNLQNVTEIGDYAFEGCTLLSDIVGLDGATSFGDFIFTACENISKLVLKFREPIEQLYVSKFFGNKGLEENDSYYKVELENSQSCYVPKGLTELEIVGDGNIPANLCDGLTSLNKFTSGKAESIGGSAFRNCSSLATLKIPEGTSSLGERAFEGCGLIKFLPTMNLTSVPAYAFSGCASLLATPDLQNVTKIGDYAFEGCTALFELQLGENPIIETIGNAAFEGCSLISKINSNDDGKLVLPSSITSVGEKAFYGVSLINDITTDVETKLGEMCFGGMDSLSKANIGLLSGSLKALFGTAVPTSLVDVKIESGSAIDLRECSSIKSLYVGDSVESIYTDYYGSSGGLQGLSSLAQLRLPSLFGHSIGELFGKSSYDNSYKVGYYSYYYIPLPLKQLTIESGTIRTNDCNGLSTIQTLVIGESVTSIGDGAFSGMTSLTDITLPFVGDAVTPSSERKAVLGHAFGAADSTYAYDFASYRQSDGKSAGVAQAAYSNNSSKGYLYFVPQTLRRVTVTVQETVPADAFRNLDLLESVTYKNGLSGTIGSSAFRDCSSLTNINSELSGKLNVIGNVDTISEYAFYGCTSFTEISLPSSLRSIGSYAFYGCGAISKLNSETTGFVNIPENLLSIGSYAFANMPLVTEVVVPESVTSIGDGAFRGMTSLIDITLPFVGDAATPSSERKAVLGHAFGANANNNHYDFASYRQSDGKSAGVAQAAYSNNSSQGYLYYVPQSLRRVTVTVQETVPADAFRNLDLLESVTYKNGLSGTIGSSAFRDCIALQSINSQDKGKAIFGNDVEGFDDYSLYNCKLISSINSTSKGVLNIENGCYKVGSFAFAYMDLVTEVVVPESVTSIGDGAFYGMSSLTDLTIPFVGDAVTPSAPTKAVLGHAFGIRTGNYYAFADYKQSNAESSLVAQATRSANSSQGSAYYVPKSLRRVTVTVQETVPADAFRNLDLLESVTLLTDCDTSALGAFTTCTAEVSKILSLPSNLPWNGTSVSSGFTTGTGAEDDPYIVSNPDTLAYLASQVNGGNSYEGVFFKLESDLNINGHSIVIGDSIEHPFAGSFDGNGHKIHNVIINSSSVLCGLFGYVTGSINNLALHKLSISSTSSEDEAKVGAVAWLAKSGQIKNVYVRNDSTVTTNCKLTVFAGGLVGYSDGIIDHSYSSAVVSSVSSTFKSYAGGLVGYANAGTISNSFVTNSVSSKGSTNVYSFAGRLVGYAEETAAISDCYANSEATVTRFGTAGSTSNEIGTIETGNNIVDWINASWDPAIWHLHYNYPTFKK